MLFALFLGLYSTGRFFISFLRQEFNSYFLSLNEAQIIALAVVIVTIPLLAYKAQWVSAVRGNGGGAAARTGGRARE
jgi:prolipoprotein diacylglyceryltransferase